MNRALKICLPIILITMVTSLWIWRSNHEVGYEAASAKQEEGARNPSPSEDEMSAVKKSKFHTQPTRKMVGEKAFVLTESHFPPKGDAVAVIEGLAPAANAGDPQAAFDIYLKVSACRRVMTSRTTDADLAVYKKAGIAQAVLEGEERTITECENLDADSELVSRNWLEMAALNGLLEAKILYAADPAASLGTSADMLKDPEKVARYRKTAVRFLNDAAESGSLDALMSLANAYDVGVMVPKNPSASYAHYLAIERADPGSIPQVILDGFRTQMSPRDMNAAMAQAQQIYSRCCVK